MWPYPVDVEQIILWSQNFLSFPAEPAVVLDGGSFEKPLIPE